MYRIFLPSPGKFTPTPTVSSFNLSHTPTRLRVSLPSFSCHVYDRRIKIYTCTQFLYLHNSIYNTYIHTYIHVCIYLFIHLLFTKERPPVYEWMDSFSHSCFTHRQCDIHTTSSFRPPDRKFLELNLSLRYLSNFSLDLWKFSSK